MSFCEIRSNPAQHLAPIASASPARLAMLGCAAVRSAAPTLLLLAAGALGGVGCASTPGAPLVPKIDYRPDGQAKARTAATSSRPLVIEWPAAERARLESSSKRGLVVVHYDDDTMEVLSRCSAPGAYAYTPTTPQREGVHIRNEDELRANLPLGAASLSSQLARSGELTVELSVVGTYETAERLPAHAELTGDCQGATHVIVALTTGAFQFFSGGAAAVGASGEALGAEAGGQSSSRRELLSEAGDMAACKASSATDEAPPFGCGALLRVEVARLATSRPLEPSLVPPVAPPLGEPGAPEPTPAPPADPEPPPRAVGPPAATPWRPSPEPAAPPAEDAGSSDTSTLNTVAIIVGVTILVGAITAGIIAGVTAPEEVPAEPAPAGLGRAAVNASGAAWRF